MAIKLDIKTILMKLVNIFPKDMYLIHNWCAIAGDESDLENRGFYFCILEPDVKELLDKTFPNKPLLYIKSVREAKTDISKVQEILDEKTIKKMDDLIELNMKSFNSMPEWNTFNFTEEELSKIFDEGQSYTLFENDETKSSIIISKSLFPLITEKTINKVRYAYDKYDDTDLNQIIMTYDYDLFQLIMRYIYINI